MSESLARVTPLAVPVPAPGPAMTGLMIAFSELRKQNARAITALSAGYGISPTDMRALIFVSLSDAATPKAVAEHLGITTGSLTTLADRLQSAGLLERTANPADRRSLLLRLTARGEQVIAELNVHYANAFSQAFDGTDLELMTGVFLGLAAALGSLAD